VSHLRRGFWQPSPLLLVVPLVLTVAAYARVLGGGFVFDDPGSLHDATVKDLAAQARLFLPALFHSGRPVVDLSLALNYAAGGLDARGYHAANIAIHLAAVFVVFAFTARTLELAGIARARGLALAVAGVFALHPLQSQLGNRPSQSRGAAASAGLDGGIPAEAAASEIVAHGARPPLSPYPLANPLAFPSVLLRDP
jgi:hypothetical protein